MCENRCLNCCIEGISTVSKKLYTEEDLRSKIHRLGVRDDFNRIILNLNLLAFIVETNDESKFFKFLCKYYNKNICSCFPDCKVKSEKNVLREKQNTDLINEIFRD